MYVYILRSEKYQNKDYIGITKNLKERLTIHNSGKMPHTSKYIPWRIEVAIWFRNKEKAFAFEKYLKHGSGKAFTKKHFL